MQSNATAGSPPIGARRVKTDLHTSEKLYVHSVGRSRSNSPMHAGLFGRHGHRKAASEPKGIPGGPLSSMPSSSNVTPTTTTTYLAVPGGSSGRPLALTSPCRQRSSSTGTSAKAQQRVLPPTAAVGGGGGGCGGSARLSLSPSRANDQLPSGAGVVNRSQLPARARLLTRRLQNNATPTNGSESPRSIDSLPRRTFAGAYKTATLSQFHNLANNNNNNGNGCTDSGSTATNSAEDLTLLDKSLRNSMLQDVVHFKKQLVRLRRILQEDEENLMMTDTLNPFESNNGQFFTTAAAVAAATIGNNGNGPATDAGNGGLGDSNRQQEQGVLIRESGVAALALLDDQRQELADLRRQVVYLQGELTTKDRTIRQQQNLIEKYEAERERQGTSNGAAAEATGSCSGAAAATSDTSAGDRNHSETISQATQTERLRPVSFGGQEGLGSRNEHPTTPKNGLRTPTAANSSSSSSPNHSQTPQNSTTNGASFSANRSTPSKTQISSVYTQLSSVRHSMAGSSAPSTPTGPGAPTALRRTSLGSSHNLSSFGLHGTPSPGSKPVRTTHIGTLAATGRQPTNGDRIPVLANGTAKHTKGTPNRTPPSAQTNGTIPTGSSPSKPSGLNGMAKRTAATIIRPPSSFGVNIAPLDAQQTMLKSKSAPATPLVPNGKLLTAPATGNTTDTSLTSTATLNGAHPTVNGRAEASGENESSGRETSDEWESDKDSVINGAIMGAVKLLPNGPAGCSDGSTTIGSTPNGIVGH